MKAKLKMYVGWMIFALLFFALLVGFFVHIGHVVGESIWPSDPVRIEVGPASSVVEV